MKALTSTKAMFVLALGIFVMSNFAYAGDSKTVEIETNAVCGMCKKNIEGGVKDKDGIIDIKVEPKKDLATVEYDPAKIDVDEIREAISMTGYDADNVKANKEARSKLMKCCRKE